MGGRRVHEKGGYSKMKNLRKGYAEEKRLGSADYSTTKNILPLKIKLT